MCVVLGLVVWWSPENRKCSPCPFTEANAPARARGKSPVRLVHHENVPVTDYRGCIIEQFVACCVRRTDLWHWHWHWHWLGQVEQLKAFAIRANLEREECLEKERALARERVDETLHASPVRGACRERSDANPSFFSNKVKLTATFARTLPLLNEHCHFCCPAATAS